MPSDAEVLGLYRSGVEAIGRLVEGWPEEQWARPACGEWTGTDLAGHLVTVIGWYHSWLDCALAGDASAPFPIGDLDARTATALAALPAGSGPDRVATFVTEAERYATRVAGHWDVPYGYPRGTVTTGLHAGVAAVEWHVHAWDLAHAAGGDHTPDDPAALFLAAAHCQLAAEGKLTARLGMPVARLASRRDPWRGLLHRLGRV
jgi:uncharacterized protein (TIGR03083 family)